MHRDGREGPLKNAQLLEVAPALAVVGGADGEEADRHTGTVPFFDAGIGALALLDIEVQLATYEEAIRVLSGVGEAPDRVLVVVLPEDGPEIGGALGQLPALRGRKGLGERARLDNVPVRGGIGPDHVFAAKDRQVALKAAGAGARGADG